MKDKALSPMKSSASVLLTEADPWIVREGVTGICRWLEPPSTDTAKDSRFAWSVKSLEKTLFRERRAGEGGVRCSVGRGGSGHHAVVCDPFLTSSMEQFMFWNRTVS